MFDAALIQQCADPGIEVAIVERFIAEAGSDNPFRVTITSGNRVILPEQPTNAEDAVRLIQRFVSQATVRVGITQFPAGYGIADAAQITPAIVDACENIRIGTALFGKVYRVVAHASDAADAAIFSAAVAAWRTGLFKERYVFGEPDPEVASEENQDREAKFEHSEMASDRAFTSVNPASGESENQDPNKAGIRIDISGVNGRLTNAD